MTGLVVLPSIFRTEDTEQGFLEYEGDIVIYSADKDVTATEFRRRSRRTIEPSQNATSFFEFEQPWPDISADEFLNNEVSRSRRHNHILSIVIIRFQLLVKDIAAQEKLFSSIDSLAGEVRELLRREDSVTKLKDQSLLVVLPETSPASASVVSKKIAHILDKAVLSILGKRKKYVIALGVASLDDQVTEADQLLEQANIRAVRSLLLHR